MDTYPPPALGDMRGKPLPRQLPLVGASVTRWDDAVGVVQPYNVSRQNQEWFPVKFGHVTTMWRMAKPGRAPQASNGVVKLTSDKIASVTGIGHANDSSASGDEETALASSA